MYCAVANNHDRSVRRDNPARDRRGRVLYRTLAGEWVRTTEEVRIAPMRNAAVTGPRGSHAVAWNSGRAVGAAQPPPEDLVNAEALRAVLKARDGIWVFTGPWKG